MSDLVSVISDQPVTTSMVIAENTEIQHKNVLSMIRQYKAELEGFGRVAFKKSTFETAGGPQLREIATLNERQATLLISFMRNGPIVKDFKVRLVQAFYDLAEEKRGALTVPKTYSEALRLAADKAEEVEQLSVQIEKDAPKVLFHDRVAISEDACTIAQAAKTMDTGRNRLFSFLRQIGWLTRYNEPYQSVIEQGLMDVKLGSFKHPTQGLKESITPLLTGKGLTKLQLLYQDEAAVA